MAMMAMVMARLMEIFLFMGSLLPDGRFFAAFRPLVRFPARAGHGNVRPAPSRQGRAHWETVVQNRYAS